MSPLNGTSAHASGANGSAINGSALHGSGPNAPALDAQQPELDAQRERLESEIAATKARAAVARERAVGRDAEVRAALKEEVEVAQARLAEMERLHHVAVGMIRDAASNEVDRILADARERLIALREQASDVD